MVVLLALTGVLLLFGVLTILNAPPIPKPTWGNPRCDATSPDGVYRCTLHLAHTGWCQNGSIEWRYESWAIGSDDDTRAATPPLAGTEVISGPATRRIPRLVFWGGIALVLWVASYGATQANQEPTYTCEWTGISCTNWKTQ